MIGSWSEDIIERTNEMGIAYTENEFYNYLDSYLEKDDNCDIVLSIEKETLQIFLYKGKITYELTDNNFDEIIYKNKFYLK